MGVRLRRRPPSAPGRALRPRRTTAPRAPARFWATLTCRVPRWGYLNGCELRVGIYRSIPYSALAIVCHWTFTMQQPLRPIPHNRCIFTISSVIGAALLGALLVPLIGCGDPVVTDPGRVEPFAGQKLTFSCPDAALADALTPMVKAWATRTGAEVVVRREPMTPTDDTDLAVIPSGHLGAWAEPGLLVPVPTKLRDSNNTFQWSGLLPAYGERLVEWGGQTVAVPLTGDGFVLVYRADRLADKAVVAEFKKRNNNRDLVPATWEDFADLARLLAEVDKKPSLPPLPADPDRLADFFFRIASSIDREALNDARLAAHAARDRDALAFQYSAVTGKPRLASSDGFKLAAEFLNVLHTA